MKVKAVARVEEAGDVGVAGALGDGGIGSSSRAAPVFVVNGAPSDSLLSSSPFSPLLLLLWQASSVHRGRLPWGG
jgi:hypothetical protein